VTGVFPGGLASLRRRVALSVVPTFRPRCSWTETKLMQHSEPSPSPYDRADLMFARRAALAEQAAPAEPRLAVHNLVAFLSRTETVLTAAQQRALFADPRLREDYCRLKAACEVFPLPALAAASDGKTVERRLESGSLRVHPSRVPQQVYVIIRYTPPAKPPRMLLLESDAGEVVKRALPEPDANGEVLIVCDTRQEVDASFVRLVSDPLTEGSFLV
jgi:hypothetical protein